MIMFLLFAAIASMPPAPLEVPEVHVSIQPSSMDSYQLLRRQTPDTYTCEADVTEAGTNRMYVHARLTMLRDGLGFPRQRVSHCGDARSRGGSGGRGGDEPRQAKARF
jgi:hypothetical protein